jgi:hypothetical protein
MNISSTLFATYTCLIVSANQAYASLIDFEDVPGGTPADKLAISTQYQGTHGVTFSIDGGGTPYLEKTGGTDSGNGFLNDKQSGDPPDVEHVDYTGDLGNYFLRLGTTSLDSAPVSTLIITYDTPVNAASAQIWDIDAHLSGNEKWTITARDDFGAIIDTINSPIGILANNVLAFRFRPAGSSRCSKTQEILTRYKRTN